MTDRHIGYEVILDSDIREDDAEYVINALRMVKGVRSVTPVAATSASAMTERRVRLDLEDRIVRAVRDEFSR